MIARKLLVAALAVGALAGPLAPTGVAGAAPASTTPAARALGAPLVDPGDLGPEPIDELAYDFGDEAFLPVGFPARVELRAKVYAPQTIADRAPLVVLQHGRHGVCASDEFFGWPCPAGTPEIPSYQGYDALGRNLASHGMIVVSIGANGINANDGFLADGGAAARAQLILEHLRRWKAWDASATGSPFGSRFVGHVDLGRVGLMGHSRGGEGVAAAVQLNQRIGSPYGIRAATLLAPVDFGRRILGGVELSVILPYCDGDVSDLQGASYYDDGRYASPGDPASKSTYLLYGANHNYFNTVWTSGPGSFDDAGLFGIIDSEPAASAEEPLPCQPGGAERLSAADQEQAGAVLMAGFLRRHLGPEPGLARFVTGAAPFPSSVGPARWAVAHHGADRLDVSSWAQIGDLHANRFDQVPAVVGPVTGMVCNAAPASGFGGGSPQGTVTQICPAAEGLASTNDTGVLDVGWTHQGTYVRQPLDPAGTDVSGYDGLRFRVAVPLDSRNAARPKQDLTVVLEDAAGARASVLASTGTNGLQRLNRGAVLHAVLNGVRLPLAAFSGVDLTRIRAIELRFDRTGAGRLSLADLAFTDEGTGAAPAATEGVRPLAPSRPACRGSASYRWACALVQLAWGRDPDDAELRSFARGYATADGRRRTIAQVLGSPLAREQVLGRFEQVYAQGPVDPELLDAILSPDGRRYWEVGRVELVATLVYSEALTTPAAAVDALYVAYVGRHADPSGLAYWVPRFTTDAAAAGRRLASSLAATAAARGRIVDERYRQILGRAPDASGRAYWVGKLASRGGEQALVSSLLATETFRAWAVH